ncbi:radical SAM protein [uncultured Desulfosarcina sp.]|uniref:radical SAM protein n=1 Tax=uncultured Desulfosarcina sp. TaxID=218289 RepID=UPI0029C7B13F|nr:radical SAM protein [uncultured Desulfosarcina sp.]
MNLTVNEIFYSIQGESVYAGLPCVFVRLTGCNLRCRYCDTRYAYDEGSAMAVGPIMDRVASFDCNLVEITGGEPLLQDRTPELAAALLAKGYEVLVETNGSLDIDRVDRRCSRIMDVKCPSSGEASKNDADNLERLTANDQVKFVIGDHEDFRFAVQTLDRLPAVLPHDRILFSRIAERLPPDRLAGWMLDANIRARMQIQLHKVIWPERDRGV